MRTLAQLGQTGKEEEGGLVRWIGIFFRGRGEERGGGGTEEHFGGFGVRGSWLVGRREG